MPTVRSSRGSSASSRRSPTRSTGRDDRPRSSGWGAALARARPRRRQRRPRRTDGVVAGHPHRPGGRRGRRDRAQRRRQDHDAAGGAGPAAGGLRPGRGARRTAPAREPADRVRPAELHRGTGRGHPLPRPGHPRADRRPVRAAADLPHRAGPRRPGARARGRGCLCRPADVRAVRWPAAARGDRPGDRRRRRTAVARRAPGQPRSAQPAGDRSPARGVAQGARCHRHGGRPRPEPAPARAHRRDLPARRPPAPRPDHRRRAGGTAHAPLRHAGRRGPDRAGRPVHASRLARSAARVRPMRLDLSSVEFRSDWLDVLQTSFMQHAMIGGSLVAVAAGLLGYFVITRQNAFAAHALAHIGFPGATGAILVGAPVTLGLAVFCVAGGLLIGLFGRRVADREMATGTILALATALGVLFASLASANASTTTSVLFGNLLAISRNQLMVFAVFTVAVVGTLAFLARPLVFASVDPEVAEARGVPVRALGLAFVVLLALTITMAVQVVGTLLLFALVVTPAATALRLTARPPVVAAVAVALALGSVWGGLVLSAMVNLPPSFSIVSLAVLSWLVVLGLIGGRRQAADPPLVDAHHPHIPAGT